MIILDEMLDTALIIMIVYCIVDPCLAISCARGEHCIALDEFNTTCQSDCAISNCTRDIVDPDVDPCSVSDPCQNEGFCYKGLDGQSACKCHFNFEGPYCNLPVDMCLRYRYSFFTARCCAQRGIAMAKSRLSVHLSVCL